MKKLTGLILFNTMIVLTLFANSPSEKKDGEFVYNNNYSFTYSVATSYSPNAITAKVKCEDEDCSVKVCSVNGYRLFFMFPSKKKNLLEAEKNNIFNSLDAIFAECEKAKSKDMDVKIEYNQDGFPTKITMASKSKLIGAPFKIITISDITLR